MSPAALDELYEADAEYIGAIETRAASVADKARFREDIRRGRIAGVWAATRTHPDYSHLGIEQSSEPFGLTHAALASYVRHNHFSHLLASKTPVVIGIRGCQHAVAAPADAATVRLVEASPDHVRLRCVVGVWRPASRSLSTYPGSTVPNLLYMRMYAENPPNDGASMLATGLHSYRVGTHPRRRQGRPGQVLRFQQPGALLMAKRAPVLRLRNRERMSYRLPDAVWDFPQSTTHNIHAAHTSSPMAYSSAGCQVVEGSYGATGEFPAGPWEGFRRSLGLDNDFIPRDPEGGRRSRQDGTAFNYLLLTGREARIFAELAARRGAESIEPSRLRLRFGSSGPVVPALRAAISPALPRGGRASGEFDVDLFKAVIAQQGARAGIADGIVTPTWARTFGFKLAGV